MKFLKITAAILSLAFLTACNSAQSVQTSGTVSESETSAVTTTSAETTETVPETEPAEIAEENEIEYVEVSPNNEFIDFEFIENYHGTTDIGDLADKAVEFLKTTDEYAESIKNISEFTDVEFSDYISDGFIVPKFRAAYPNDYDGDGRTETFIAVDMPVHYYYNNILTSFYIYADSSENMTLLSVSGRPDENAVLLNYGRDKQIAFGGGLSPYGSICYLYGVKDGEPVLLYSEQAELEKRSCFLRSHGFQATERFMYYDTITRKYRQIASVQIPLEELKALDSSGSLNSVFEEHGDRFSAWVMGGKYYCIKVLLEFADVYTYDSGTFTLIDDPPVGLNIPDSIMPCVIDIDIDKAIAEMKPPKEPFVEVSPNNEFIDFEFIENYHGTTDIGDLADKAVEFLKTTEYYAKSMENIEKINTDELKTDWDYNAGEFFQRDVSMYFNGDGSIQPVFAEAYPADYDGDGKTETFIVVNMPFMPMVTPDIWGFLLFADSGGNIYPEVLDWYNPYSAELLNYGKFRHLCFGGADSFRTYSSIYGVKDGKPVNLYDHMPGGYFCKTDCFLTAYGLQGGSDFMYFDTVALEYRVIKGVEVSHAEMAELDVSNTLCSNFGEESIDELPDYVEFHFIKPNYYLLDWGLPGSVLFTYENGVFTLVEDSNITRSSNGRKLNAIGEFDIDKAVAEMKKTSENITQSAAEKYINEIFNFIKKENILCGCFYDFNRDGFPELVNMQPGETYYSYIIYDIQGGTPARIGTITVNDTEYADIEFSLYKDKNSGELFCFGQNDTIFWGQNKNDITDINIFKFKNGHIETERVGFYSHRYNSDDPMKIYIEDNYFMDCQAEAGEYNRSELADVLGINDYLSQFEKIEKIMLEKEWNYDDWETVRTAVTKALNTNSLPM